MSRTTFTERFKSLVGMPPLSYLIRWRMAVAGAALKTGKSLSAIAESVGYGSDVAFNSAFKRTTGRSPGAIDRRTRKIWLGNPISRKPCVRNKTRCYLAKGLGRFDARVVA
jgi:AraC-like DNA-binding protein